MVQLSNDIIDAAIEGFEAQKQRIDQQIAELRSMRDGRSTPTSASATGKKQRRKLSPEAIARMREGQQRRWAKARGETTPAAPTVKLAKKKRTLSPEGRKAIQEAVRKRWAAKRAQATSAAKKTASKKATKTTKRATSKTAAATGE